MPPVSLWLFHAHIRNIFSNDFFFCVRVCVVLFEYCILQLQIFEQKADGEAEVHTSEMWATKRCPHAATRHHTLALSADMAYFLSMADVDSLQGTTQMYP